MVKLSWNRSLSRIPNTTDEKQKNCRQMGEGLDGTRSGPHTLQVQNGGPVNWHTSVITIVSYQCKALFGFLSLKKATRAFCYSALLTVDGFSSKGLEKIRSLRLRYFPLKLVFVCVIYVCMVMLLCCWAFTTTIQAMTKSDEDYMLTDVLLS